MIIEYDFRFSQNNVLYSAAFRKDISQYEIIVLPLRSYFNHILKSDYKI